MVNITFGDPATDTAAVRTFPEPEKTGVVPRTDVGSLRPSVSGSERRYRSLSSTSTNDDQVSPDAVHRQSILSRLKNILHKAKYRLGRQSRERHPYFEHFTGDKGVWKALRTIVRKVIHPGIVPKEPPYELHVPPNNVCDKGTQGFKGMVETGSRGYSLIRESVVSDLFETYVPIERFSTQQRDFVMQLPGIHEDSGYLQVLGGIILEGYHPDTPHVMFHPEFYVVPDTDMEYDFLVGIPNFGAPQILRLNRPQLTTDCWWKVRPG
ncbi:hypothetical protein H2202_007956 [Exophiala xenobiotica]|nr:hypothetical protein H2202_007956 [Exophiala xenobiotica]KAK5204035.1 hypothetical protein LTR41_010246 [Exophiala xenobiotica]KAK5216415.1 hypothetical protein LTR72_010589 [Exophiala xenobiotica]KAK5227606.1 hypothetical protein LTR47_008648 [Exophiala xenobiotica]KAK5241545.1 hypothetical protein LTS06_012038 [Exophiala xenobiotica]